MSLDLGKLEKVRELGNGIVQARCPACAEGGHDRAGEHLRIYPDGRFGCCVYPKDRAHRKQIFALAGTRTPRQFTVKVTAARPAAQGARSVTASLTGLLRTLRTGVSESETSPMETVEDFRTLRTPILMSRAYAREEKDIMYDVAHTCKDSENGVLSVLRPPEERLPFFTPGGSLSIPFDSPDRYHWWKPDGERMSVEQTTADIYIRMAAEQEEYHGHEF